MTDPTPTPTGVAADILQALTAAHPQPCTVSELADTTGADRDTVIAGLAQLNATGHATPSSPFEAAGVVWMLHGPARQAAYEAQAQIRGGTDA